MGKRRTTVDKPGKMIIHIRYFGVNKESYQVIDRIVEDFLSLKGIVVDARNSGGGSD